MNKTIVYLLMLLIPCFLLDAEGQDNKKLEIRRINQHVKIDGKLNEAFYSEITPVSDFVQFHPKNGEKATFKTEVFSYYDKKNVYFAFKCYDPQRDRIIADITPFGGYEDNDEVSVYLDAFFDRQNHEIFSVNPKGVKSGKVTVWDADARLTDYGWAAEIKIPYKSLRFPVREIQTWGVNFKREIFRLNETDYWNQVPRDKESFLSDTFGTLEGLKNIKGGKNIEFFPYVGYRNSRGNGDTDDKLAYGLDFKYGITSNLTLDLTTSPDYSEVESDPFFYQLYAFEEYLNENRPFYNEAGNYFQTRFELFYSRRITNPTLALKLTGKEKGYSLGLLAANNDVNGKDKFHGVFRLKKDLFKLSSIGIIYTGIEEKGNWNRNMGVDFLFRFKDIYRISGMAAFSFNKDIEKKKNGLYNLFISRSPDRGVSVVASFTQIGPNVYVPAGYIYNTDYANLTTEVAYNFRWEGKWLERLSLKLQKIDEKSVDEKLKVQDRVLFRSDIALRNKLNMTIFYSFGKFRTKVLDDSYRLVYHDILFPTNIYALTLSYRGSKAVQMGVDGFVYDDFATTDDFTDARAGITAQGSVWTNFKISPQWQLRLDYSRTIYKSEDKTIDFKGNLFSSSLNYQISRQLSSFLKFQYDSHFERFQYDFLIGYEPANVSKIYFSIKNYTEGRFRFFNPDARSISLKVSYLFRF